MRLASANVISEAIKSKASASACDIQESSDKGSKGNRETYGGGGKVSFILFLLQLKKGGVAKAKGEGEKEKECTTEWKSRRR